MKKLQVAVWCCLFLILADFLIGRLTRFATPFPIQDHENIGRFLAEAAEPDLLFVGSSRARDLEGLVADGRNAHWRILPVSGGSFSTLKLLLQEKLSSRYGDGRPWPKGMVLVIHPFDFEKTGNDNIPSVIWSWGDFARSLADGLGEDEKNFLRNRFISWFRFSALAKDRNERAAFATLVAAAKGGRNGAGGGQAPSLEAHVERLEKVLSSRDPREEESFAALVDFLRGKGVALRILCMPYPPSVEARVDGRKVAAFKEYCERMGSGNGAGFDMLTAAGADLKDADFDADLIHLNDAGRKAISRFLLARGSLAAGGSR